MPTSSDDVPNVHHVLGGTSLYCLAQYIINNDIRKILVLAGAGISVAAGIPDFRSPTTGLYANLGKYKLDDAADAFSLSLLREKPEIFYAIAREMNLWPGNFKPTLVHYFIKLLEDQGRLLRVCTQNIDGLERQAGVSEEKLVEAHGSFNTASCVECRAPFDIDLNRDLAFSGAIPRCEACGGVVKPDVVFFGEQLPERFFEVFDADTEEAELLIIIGTSLQVHPFASLPLRVDKNVPRALFNMERAGGAMFRFAQDAETALAADSESSEPSTASSWHESASESSSDGYAQYGSYSDHGSVLRDVFFPGDCQENIRRLAQLLGLQSELNDLLGH